MIKEIKMERRICPLSSIIFASICGMIAVTGLNEVQLNEHKNPSDFYG